MSTYLVRLKDYPDSGKQELVYFGAARTLYELWWIVDQVTSPTLCEYTRVKEGGVFWHSPETGIVNIEYSNGEDFPEVDDEERDEVFKGAQFGNQCADLYDDSFKWKSFMPYEQIVATLVYKEVKK